MDIPELQPGWLPKQVNATLHPIPTFSHQEILIIHKCFCCTRHALQKRLDDNPNWPEDLKKEFEASILEIDILSARVVVDYLDYTEGT